MKRTLNVKDKILQKTSEEIDDDLGFNIKKIESDLVTSAKKMRPLGNMSSFGEVLHKGNQTWVGLDPQTLNTPYSELLKICDLLPLNNDEIFIDLGAGYGRMGIVLHMLFPGVKFFGYELVPERVNEGRRIFEMLGAINAKIDVQDLTDPDFNIPIAQYYFLYDFGKVHHIRKILHQLESLADMNHHFKVIARGKGSRSIIESEHPWLALLNEVHHEENFSIYSF